MTATPAGSTENTQVSSGLPGLRRRGRAAGGLFGIDLAGLFKDEESDGGGFQGFLSPEQTTTYLKGRSPSTLTYKAAKTPSRTVTSSIFKLAEAVPTLPQEAAKPTEPETETESKADRLLSSFIGEMGDPNKKILGAVGLGRAMEYGLSEEDILRKAKEEGMTFGEQAARTLGLSDLLQYQGPEAQGRAIGLEALGSARMAGLGDDLIKQFAQEQGVGFGEKAATQLGVPNISNLSQYIGAEGTQGTLGLEAVNKAKQMGLTNQQITSLASQQGLGFGSAAAEQLGVPQKTQLSQYIGGAGSTPGYLGLEAVNRAEQAGLSTSQIKSLASQQGLSFGSAAAQKVGAPAPAPKAPDLSKFISSAGTSGTLGLEAVNRARQSGLSDSQIRQYASQQGLGFGGAAKSALGL